MLTSSTNMLVLSFQHTSHVCLPVAAALDILFILSLFTAKVGKTSLIMSLVGEEFPEEVSVHAAVYPS